ncbi:hypothetical protein M501DRAFT_1005339 [Patellaria atrata CBS 101060]|uniref:Uncharacterized protein n=1 Tax=Patellaria atrata CBS 101060 TaxID=1346257 RepID=A0A9P4VR37_9PEZI|nr:hypothetical protein M501DRAFT_1005339 [Patellaria atrata CBS 101060]
MQTTSEGRKGTPLGRTTDETGNSESRDLDVWTFGRFGRRERPNDRTTRWTGRRERPNDQTTRTTRV